MTTTIKRHNVYAISFGSRGLYLAHIYQDTYWKCKQYIKNKNPGGAYVISKCDLNKATAKFKRLYGDENGN